MAAVGNGALTAFQRPAPGDRRWGGSTYHHLGDRGRLVGLGIDLAEVDDEKAAVAIDGGRGHRLDRHR
jgi:hypothetical protein